MNSPTTANLTDIWGVDNSQIYAVGNEGIILHFDGAIWSRQFSGTDANLRDVWGTAENDIWAVGHEGDTPWNPGDGVILHYDGNSWTEVTSILVAVPPLIAIWGSSPQDIFAVGDEGAMMHYDGFSWTAMTSGVSNSLYTVWGTGPSEVFAAGSDGTILFYDGSSWTPMDSGTDEYIWAIWGTGSVNIFAAGGNGIFHFDGESWSLYDNMPTRMLCLTGDSPVRAFAAGAAGTLMSYDGADWSRLSSGPLVDFSSVWGSSGTDVYVGGGGGYLYHFDGSSWSQVNWEYDQDIGGIWCAGPNDVYVGVNEVDDDAVGTVLHYDGASWTEIYTCQMITAMWGIGSDLFVGTLRHTNFGSPGGRVHHFDGADWTDWSICDTHAWPRGIAAIYGFAPDDVYVLCACGGPPYAGGSSFLHYDGNNWTMLDFLDCANAMWGTSGTDLYIGIRNDVAHYDGNSLTSTGLETVVGSRVIRGLRGSASSDIYAVTGSTGYILFSSMVVHYDGINWSLEVDIVTNLSSIWGDDLGQIFVAGDLGAILNHSAGPTSVNEQPEVKSFSVRCYPNPFNPQTTVEYYLPRSGPLTVKVYNLRGELIRTLLDEMATDGLGTAVWDGTDDDGMVVAAGVYVFELIAPGVREVQKAALLK
jgi:hypothetical protein